MLPPPPTRFSTTSCWPRRSPSFCPTRRATVSELLPAVNGTIKRIGRSGQRVSLVCACAALAASSPANNAEATRATTMSPEANPPATIRQPWCQSYPLLSSAGSRNLLGLAQALDQRRPQQERARELRVLRRTAQLVVILPAHRRVLFGQQPLVADGLRLRVLHGDVTALALVT